MDSKTKHRILGVLVIAGLIVILLPFFQSGKEPSTEASTVKTPPFPDQSIQVTTAPSVQTVQIPMTTSTTTADEVKQQPDDTIKTNHTALTPATVPSINNPAVEKQTTTAPQSPQSSQSNSTQQTPKEAESNKPVDESTTASHSAPKTAPKKIKKVISSTSHVHGPIDDNGLFKLHSAAWVIQVGSFKNKANALRVVNSLRANGYRAFIQQVSSTSGDNIRVFVGPESKQSSARELAQVLENHMHLRGIVISYQPLAL